MRRIYLLFIASVLALVLIAGVVEAQWIALNYEVRIGADGTARVRIKLHPFTEEGESLFGSANVTEWLEEAEGEFITDALLLFSERPADLKYEVVSHIHEEPEEFVLCDVYGEGRMTQLRGAYVIEVLVYLNTSSYIEKVEDSVFRVKIKDVYTSRDPRSWIDVLEIELEPGVELLEYSWDPPSAKNATEVGERYLLWLNYNEPEAPDEYALVLYVPGLELAAKPPEAEVEIESVTLVDGEVLVNLRARRGSGYFLVRLVGEGVDETRKIYLEEGDERVVRIPLPTGSEGNLLIEVWHGRALLASEYVRERGFAGIAARPFTATLAIVLGAFGLILVALGLREREAS